MCIASTCERQWHLILQRIRISGFLRYPPRHRRGGTRFHRILPGFGVGLQRLEKAKGAWQFVRPFFLGEKTLKSWALSNSPPINFLGTGMILLFLTMSHIRIIRSSYASDFRLDNLLNPHIWGGNRGGYKVDFPSFRFLKVIACYNSNPQTYVFGSTFSRIAFHHD